ncbi:hypothetical protein C2E20_1281 [Micractinium conductrix]|uniref:Uncharacterized protein n=1 Tax=Micractinium conductrix TaxID=554055 RepID=A0A2P6VNY9_9CHLO|nr:hypothetical protein C2E20_1281 [Micractinium conductrix]|eukprot:PSC75775.1 hypothetical protein C2E20_1281 [Micractinium conductrix]
MPGRAQSCPHCPPGEDPKLPPCCGVCIFTTRRCDDLHPGRNRTQAAAKLLVELDPLLADFTPCELFQRIRGRTLWFLGDSQTWNFYYAAECFMREFAPSLRRTPALSPPAENQKLVTRPPPEIPPLCLDLAFGTRVCGIRMYGPLKLRDQVLPQLIKHAPNFSSDVLVFNIGLHFPKPGADGKPPAASALVRGMSLLSAWIRQHRAQLPKIVWMDTPAQHFETHDGSWPGGPVPFKCRPLHAWYKSDPDVLAGGPFNAPLAPLVPRFADGHLRAWNASVPLWEAHWRGECTHWCHPTAYQHWLHLLNGVLRDNGLGNPVGPPSRSTPAEAAAAAAAGAGGSDAGPRDEAAAAAGAEDTAAVGAAEEEEEGGDEEEAAEAAAGADEAEAVEAEAEEDEEAAEAPAGAEDAGAAAPAGAAGDAQQAERDAARWEAAPGSSFRAPHSLCTVDSNGTAFLPPPAAANSTAMPFLFDTSTMPTKEEACSHCPAKENVAVPPCCGVCVFAGRRCEQFYPGEGRSEEAAADLTGRGFNLGGFTPCELFQRIRGRTLWLMGDSQTWNLYYATECFMREFATTLQRRPAVQPHSENEGLITVRGPAPFPPICLELALGTRVCVVRVDSIQVLWQKVLPKLQELLPTFPNDLLVLNFGLHYHPPGADGRPANQSGLYSGLATLAGWRRERRGQLPRFIWMDTPIQHFQTRDGSWPGGKMPYNCSAIEGWLRGEPDVLWGGPFNAPLEPLIPELADAHLRTWNASATLWRSHWPGECSHWCHPSAYQLWILLLNDVLRDNGLGNAGVEVRGSSDGGGAPGGSATGDAG